MRITIEISMYPLQDQYIDAIKKFIAVLNKNPDLLIRTNGVSTQVFGEFDAASGAVMSAIKDAVQDGAPVVFVTKIIGRDVSDYGKESGA